VTAPTICWHGWVLDIPTPMPTLAEMERSYIENVLTRCNWNIAEAARVLDVHRNTLHRLLRLWRAA
jgi:transcriptional regulator of acetoin/glycerol metabolism